VLERVAYANAILAYKGLVQKLRGRIEELETDKMKGIEDLIKD
jgi:hypothetical protein